MFLVPICLSAVASYGGVLQRGRQGRRLHSQAEIRRRQVGGGRGAGNCHVSQAQLLLLLLLLLLLCYFLCLFSDLRWTECATSGWR